MVRVLRNAVFAVLATAFLAVSTAPVLADCEEELECDTTFYCDGWEFTGGCGYSGVGGVCNDCAAYCDGRGGVDTCSFGQFGTCPGWGYCYCNFCG